MMRYDKEKIIDELALSPFGTQGWLHNKNMECPFCGKAGKWGIIFNDVGGATFHCWKCPKKDSLYNFLVKLGRKDLLKKSYEVSPSKIGECPKIGGIYMETSQWMGGESEEESIKQLKPVSLPFRMKPLKDDEYLNDRGFQPHHYEQFEPSYTNSPLEKKLHNFIIFKMKIDGVCVAWWARSRYTKEWHKANLEAYKRHEEDLVLRYRNSENNFQDLLGGYDEIIKGETHTVIIVEGIFDKVNLDNILGLHDNTDVKCCFTFGNNIGRGQVEYLTNKGVKNVILLYDFGTIQESKESAMRIREKFNVYVCAIRKEGVDPGNIDIDYLNEVIKGAVDPLTFFCNKVEVKLK